MDAGEREHGLMPQIERVGDETDGNQGPPGQDSPRAGPGSSEGDEKDGSQDRGKRHHARMGLHIAVPDDAPEAQRQPGPCQQLTRPPLECRQPLDRQGKERSAQELEGARVGCEERQVLIELRCDLCRGERHDEEERQDRQHVPPRGHGQQSSRHSSAAGGSAFHGIRGAQPGGTHGGRHRRPPEAPQAGLGPPPRAHGARHVPSDRSPDGATRPDRSQARLRRPEGRARATARRRPDRDRGSADRLRRDRTRCLRPG